MKIAIIGDVHGKIKEMYELVSEVESKGISIDAILQVGDFQAIRDESDLKYFSAPQKHKDLGSFNLFYQKGKVPKKTFFIGGNHDNDHWHKEHPEGKEIIEDLTYLGRSGVTDLNGIRIGWISGNYSPVQYHLTNPKFKHYTQKDLERVSGHSDLDILLFHDWPSIKEMAEITTSTSDREALEQAVKRNLGSRELFDLVKQTKPRYVFAGHVHMPLDLQLSIDDSKTRFISLGRLNNPKSLYLLDTKSSEIKPYN